MVKSEQSRVNSLRSSQRPSDFFLCGWDSVVWGSRTGLTFKCRLGLNLFEMMP